MGGLVHSLSHTAAAPPPVTKTPSKPLVAPSLSVTVTSKLTYMRQQMALQSFFMI
jgi:hypothetical protein